MYETDGRVPRSGCLKDSRGMRKRTRNCVKRTGRGVAIAEGCDVRIVKKER